MAEQQAEEDSSQPCPAVAAAAVAHPAVAAAAVATGLAMVRRAAQETQVALEVPPHTPEEVPPHTPEEVMLDDGSSLDLDWPDRSLSPRYRPHDEADEAEAWILRCPHGSLQEEPTQTTILARMFSKGGKCEGKGSGCLRASDESDTQVLQRMEDAPDSVLVGNTYLINHRLVCPMFHYRSVGESYLTASQLTLWRGAVERWGSDTAAIDQWLYYDLSKDDNDLLSQAITCIELKRDWPSLIDHIRHIQGEISVDDGDTRTGAADSTGATDATDATDMGADTGNVDGGGSQLQNQISGILRLLPEELKPVPPDDMAGRTDAAREAQEQYRNDVVSAAERHARVISPTVATGTGQSLAETLMNHVKKYRNIQKKNAETVGCI